MLRRGFLTRVGSILRCGSDGTEPRPGGTRRMLPTRVGYFFVYKRLRNMSDFYKPYLPGSTMNNHLQVATRLANLLDNRFQLGKYRFGLSALLDLIPGIGDLIDAVLSLYLVWIAFQMAVPGRIILRMLWNIAINFIWGAVPVVGDLIYVFRKVNLKNLQLLHQYAGANSG